MSMIGHLRAITPFELRRFQLNPKLLDEFLYGSLHARLPQMIADLERWAAEAKGAGLQRVSPAEAHVRSEPQAAAALTPAEERGLSLEKTWHLLHYLLTGSAGEASPPLGDAILGGKPIGPERGYGPVRFLTPAKVREVAVALAAISGDDLARRFAPDTMEALDLYAIGGDSDLARAQQYFGRMVEYYTEAAAEGNAMLLYID